ncbi:hypothetical protein FAM09_03630 [Niastella caeni]|uniref:Redoxin domain-containing protein n=1 Tax=Niastella caeni TaxID=2569763 RepID=A0A4V4H1N6_9BACT|nr:hypothetical protein [Niastella caeni]THU41216.1 hypothetical protein FAM09_03630 [Niastella caeni]
MKTIFLCCSLILISLGFLLYWKKNEKDKEKMTHAIARLETVNKALANNLMIQSKVSSIPLDLNKLIVKDTSGKQASFITFLNSPKKIVFRIAESYCMECVKSQFSFMKQISGKIGKQNVAILASFSNMKMLKIFLQENNIEVDAYNIVPEAAPVKLAIEQLYSPYYFKADKSTNGISNVFLAEKALPDLTQAYCDEVTSKF